MTTYSEKSGAGLLENAFDPEGQPISLRRIGGQLVSQWPHVIDLAGGGTLSIFSDGSVVYADADNPDNHPVQGQSLTIANFGFTLWDGTSESPEYTATVELNGVGAVLVSRRLHLPDKMRPSALNSDFVLNSPELQAAYPNYTLTEVASQPYVTNQWYQLPQYGEIRSVSANGYLQVRGDARQTLGLDVFETQSHDLSYQIADNTSQTANGRLLVIFEGTKDHAGTIPSLSPDWAEIRLSVPNNLFGPDTFTTLGGAIWSADNYVSENMTKVGFIADGPLAGDGSLQYSFNEFDAQVATLADVRGEQPQFDLHGPIWHTSLTNALKSELLSNPTSAKFHIDHMLDACFAHFPFLGFDVNEVQRTTGGMDASYNYWRGPINQLPGDSRNPVGANGSVWYEAFSLAEAASPGYWPHDPGYWWLHAVEWANTNNKKVVYQDFNFEAGREWGAGDVVPTGFEPRTDEHLKRRRILDAVNYALVHGYQMDAVAFQAHIRTDRAIDENDLAVFLWCAEAMGLGVEATELDVEPVGAPAGSSDSDAQAVEFAGIYTERFLALMLANSKMHRVGGWSAWTPPGKLQRLAMVDRQGNTGIGLGLLAALNGAQSPEQRPSRPIMRRYMLTNGVTDDLWRASSDPLAAGFQTSGNKQGTKAVAGSGGAVLPLINPSSPVPKAPVAAVWSDNGTIRNYDPANMAAAFQWFDGDDAGTRIALLSGGATLVEIRLNGSEIEIVSGASTFTLGQSIPFSHNRVCLSWSAGSLDVTFDSGAEVFHQTSLPLAQDPDQIRLLGDGASTISQSRACVLEVFKDPLSENERTMWAKPQGSQFASAANYRDRTPFRDIP